MSRPPGKSAGRAAGIGLGLGAQTREAGFTLIELMIVVGIIGILVAIAAPNFNKYQAKSRQSEAKIALAAIYLGEKSFFSEYSVYIGACDAIGYGPEGIKRLYAVGWNAVANATSAGLVGYAGSSTIAGYDTLNAPYAAAASATLLSSTADNFFFTAVAAGTILNNSPTNDVWTINDNKALVNSTVGF